MSTFLIRELNGINDNTQAPAIAIMKLLSIRSNNCISYFTFL